MPPAFPLSDADLHTMGGFQSSAAAPLCFGTVLCTPIPPVSRCLKMLGSRKAGVQNTPAFKHHRKRHLLHRLRPVFLRQHYLYQVLRVKTVRFTLRPPRPPHCKADIRNPRSIYMTLTAYSALQIFRIASAKIFALRSSISISMNSSSPCM